MWGLCVWLLGPDVSPSRFNATSPTGNIYDLGYRHYEGKRNGRAYAMWSLFVESFRGIWGFGRPTTAKVAPFLLAGFYALPAVVQLAFSSVITQQVASGANVTLLTYDSYFPAHDARFPGGATAVAAAEAVSLEDAEPQLSRDRITVAGHVGADRRHRSAG